MKYKKTMLILGISTALALAAGAFIFRTTHQSVVEQPELGQLVVEEPSLENNYSPAPEATPPKSAKPSLIQECPDEWYENRMPGNVGDNMDRQYFIFKGERREIKDYDMDWVKNNCSIQLQYVY